MTTDSLFSTCSTTKAFTAAAMSLVVDERKNTPCPVSWDTPLSSIIREDFVLADDHATANTTIEDALSHRSGLPGHEAAMMMAYPDESLRQEVRKLRHLPLAYAPRSGFMYCNHMYMAVTHALEKLNEESLGGVLKRRLWDPLGMHNTYFSIEEAKKSNASANLVRGYTWASEFDRYVEEPYMDYAPTTGAGSMVSNVLDYAKWLRSLIYQSGPMSSDGYAALLTPRSITTDSGDIAVPPAPYHLYALGWFIDQIHGERLYWHSGSWPGFGIMVGFIPGQKWGFAMMGNTVNARMAEMQLYMYLIGQLLGVSTPMSPMAQDRPKATDQLCPCLPDPPIPHSRPLHCYTGVYKHLGYGSFELALEDGKLTANLMDRVEPQRWLLEHLSSEFFSCLTYDPAKGKGLGQRFRMEFHVNVTGHVTAVGVDLEPALGKMNLFESVV